ncbi:hypothetical protein KJ766_01310, partial [Patescibacteria group bacterium]|nr:hypothetical protein [Patescibacteria group bacterium]
MEEYKPESQIKKERQEQFSQIFKTEDLSPSFHEVDKKSATTLFEEAVDDWTFAEDGQSPVAPEHNDMNLESFLTPEPSIEQNHFSSLGYENPKNLIDSPDRQKPLSQAVMSKPALHQFDLMDQSSVKQKNTRQKRKILLPSFLVLFSCFLAWNFLASFWLVTGALDGKDAIERAEAQVMTMDLEKVSEEITSAKNGFVKAKRGAWMLRWTYVLPWVGEQMKAVNLIVDSGAKVLIVVEDASNLGLKLLSVIKE